MASVLLLLGLIVVGIMLCLGRLMSLRRYIHRLIDLWVLVSCFSFDTAYTKRLMPCPASVSQRCLQFACSGSRTAPLSEYNVRRWMQSVMAGRGPTARGEWCLPRVWVVLSYPLKWRTSDGYVFRSPLITYVCADDLFVCLLACLLACLLVCLYAISLLTDGLFRLLVSLK